MKISLIIPTYNNGNIIQRTLEKLNSFIKKEKQEWEVLIVNDGSTDNTLELLKNYQPKFHKTISYFKNKGKGFAVKRGVEKASGKYISFLDSDLPYSFDNLKSVLLPLKDFDISIGSRTLFPNNNNENIEFLRRFIGKGSSFVSNAMLKYNIKDTQCGLKAFRKNVAKDIFSKQTIKGFYFDPEILYIAKKQGYTIKEVRAILLKTHQMQLSSVNVVGDSVKCFLDLLKIRLNDIRGKYG